MRQHISRRKFLAMTAAAATAMTPTVAKMAAERVPPENSVLVDL